MRSTLTLDDDIGNKLKRLAAESGIPFKRVVNETLQAGLRARKEPRRAKTYRLQPVSLGGPREGVDLDKALRLADELDDQEIAAKLRMRK